MEQVNFLHYFSSPHPEGKSNFAKRLPVRAYDSSRNVHEATPMRRLLRNVRCKRRHWGNRASPLLLHAHVRGLPRYEFGGAQQSVFGARDGRAPGLAVSVRQGG